MKKGRLLTIEKHLADRRKRWLASLSDEELASYFSPAELAAQQALLRTLSNEQLLKLYHGASLDSVLSQEVQL